MSYKVSFKNADWFDAALISDNSDLISNGETLNNSIKA